MAAASQFGYRPRMTRTCAVAVLAAAVAAFAKPPPVSSEVKATLDAWELSTDGASYPVAVLKFTNNSKKACTVKRYRLHWTEGSYEEKPAGLKVEAGKTVEHRANLTEHAMPADPGKLMSIGADGNPVTKPRAIVQVWETDCR